MSGKEVNTGLESLWQISVIQEVIIDLFTLCILDKSVKVGLKQLDRICNVAKV